MAAVVVSVSSPVQTARARLLACPQPSWWPVSSVGQSQGKCSPFRLMEAVQAVV
jgi:hypothetical protein